jgi:hypothetical protein
VAEAQSVELFDELDGVAGGPAGGRHAAPQALAGCDDEVRRFLVFVEGTEASPVGALLFEGDAPRLDQCDQVGFGFDPVDFGVGDAGHVSCVPPSLVRGSIFPACPSSTANLRGNGFAPTDRSAARR